MAGARIGYVLTSPEVVEDLQRVRLPYHLSALTQAAGIVALRHADEAMSILDAIRAQRDRIVDALSGDRRRHRLSRPTRTSCCSCRRRPAPREVWQGLLDRGVLIRDLSRRRAERAARDRGRRARGRPVPRRASGRCSPHDRSAHRHGDPHDQGDRRPRRARPRRVGHDRRPTPACRSSTTCCSSSASTPAGTSTVTCKGDLQVDGHHTVEDCGHRDRPGARPRRSATRPGIRRFASITVPLDEAAVEVALDLAGRNFVVHEVPVPAETIGTFDTGPGRGLRARVRAGGEPHDPRAPAVRALAAPRLRGRVQGDGQGARRRVRA